MNLRFFAFSRASSHLNLRCLFLLAGSLAAVRAADQEANPAPQPSSLYDKIWGYAEWYKADDNPVIQSFNFTGRFQLDYSVVDSDQGDHHEWNIRRFRLGGKARLFSYLTLHGEAEINPQEPDPLYQRLTDMYLAWSQSKGLIVTVGKHCAPFTLDGSTSSRELLTIDRGNLANNLWFPNEYFPGVSLSGKPGQWRYLAGIYSSGAENPEFGEFNGGAFFLGTVGYDFAPLLEFREALLALNYVYNEPDAQNTWTRDLQNILSLNLKLDTGKWGLRSDLTGGTGYLGQSDLWGAVLLPFYNITEKFQVVARYTFLKSDHENGLRLALYENIIVPGRGDQYNEFYLGLNYYFYKHKLKLQTGAQYAHMKDRAQDGGQYSGWAWTTGLRISW